MMTKSKKIFSVLVITLIFLIVYFPKWSQASSYFYQEIKIEYGEVQILLDEKWEEKLGEVSEKN